jgi:hypothetical protein
MVPASEEMREYFGLARMVDPVDAREWFESLWGRYPFTDDAIAHFRTQRLEMGTVTEELGGGFWFGDRGLVLLRGAQDEAAVHELAHAWWESRREIQRDALMRLLKQLGERPPRSCARISELASVYCQGIPSQQDETSPTGYWRGMLVTDNDHETFAGFCSGVMANPGLLPPKLRRFYRGFLAGA